ncbi:MAG: hypothetical protein ACK4N5_21445, partial [Myxococcales bacterium]
MPLQASPNSAVPAHSALSFRDPAVFIVVLLAASGCGLRQPLEPRDELALLLLRVRSIGGAKNADSFVPVSVSFVTQCVVAGLRAQRQRAVH